MDKLKYQLNGEMYDEKIKIQYGNLIIYDSYVDDLVTSISGELELKLNYGNPQTTNPVIAKLTESQICLVPKCPYCFYNEYEYTPIIMTQEKFNQLWTAMKYDTCSDMTYINQITSDEMLLMWSLSSKCRYPVDNTKDFLKYLHSKILCTSKESDLFQKLINKLFYYDVEELSFESTIIDTTDTMEKVFIYLDKETNYEWDAFRIDGRSIYLNLGMNKCIPIFKKM